MNEEYSLSEKALIFLDSFSGLEYKHKAAVLGAYKNVSDIFSKPTKMLEIITENVSESAAKTVENSLSKDFIGNRLDELNKKGVKCVTFLSDAYPETLLDIPFKPLVLYCKGNIKLLNSEKSLSAVGSRKTLPQSLMLCEKICREFSESGVTVITGSASGGDESAILGAEKSGRLICVLAHGHDYVYPERNRSLINKVSQNGLVISEYPPETPSSPWLFPMRNRIIAALNNGGCLIISGDMQSGTRHTAKFAEAYSKNIFCFPYAVGTKSGEICNYLIKIGKASLVENAEDISLITSYPLEKPKTENLSEQEKIVFSIISEGEAHIDLILAKSGMKIYELMPLLSSLEIKGLIGRNSGNSYFPI